VRKSAIQVRWPTRIAGPAPTRHHRDVDPHEKPFADAVVVAAGASRRMGGNDKLFADLAGRPVLRWALDAMAAAASVRGIVVVAAPERVPMLSALPWLEAHGARVVAGGERRQDSVAAGVRATDAEVVLVHDGARPFVAPDVVDAVAVASREYGAAIPVLPVVDSLKRVASGLIVGIASRTDLFRAQTPQGARRDLLLAATEALASGPEEFGDEAELLARHGAAVTTVAGDPANLKLTVTADLELARTLAAGRTGVSRVGFGTDSHPFGPEMGLRLGGIELAEAPRLAGHSDGDVVLHAICDALLGAAGLPDLGRSFPANDPTTRGIAGADLVHEVMRRVAAAGRLPTSVDVTVLGARPRLGGKRLDAMREVIAGLLDMEPGSVAVKASSGNLSGDEGAGRVIAATAVVGVARR
jgi:2-C-methyl-D-erythritol 4-phosphate cytidylyltransferase/2-C-methyl-D-erythritol 2,4-cyclodiphosphate synthase